MAWRIRPLQLELSGGPVTPTPIREYNGLRGENRDPFKGQQASESNPVMHEMTMLNAPFPVQLVRKQGHTGRLKSRSHRLLF